jgi:predicted Zn finger-like uncharacterized protein
MVDDDLEPLITRCPNCSTQFRVTENQLAAAGGRVRCGACLTVFEGTEHLILDEENTFHDGSEADAALDALLDELGPLDQPVSTTVESERDDAGNAAFLRGTSVDLEPLEEAQLYGGFEEEPAGGSAAVADSEVAEAEASEAEFSEAETSEETQVSEAVGEDLEAAPETESAGESEAPVLRVHTPGEASAADAQDPDYEAWIRPGLSNLDQLVDEVVASGASRVRAEPEPDLASSEAEKEAEKEAEAPDGFNLSAVEQALAEEGVGTEPIRFGPEPRRWWIPVAAVGLTLVLAAQFMYLKLPEWSRDPGTRGFYETVCGVLGCELPEIRALDELRTRNLMVRSHPDLQDTLIIDAVIVNTADFPQRYPDLELRFTSVGGLLVAGRAFRPEEYLGGEARADRLMPVNTPIQVSIEIADPGGDAVNYTLSFR